MPTASHLRAQIESTLAKRIPSALTPMARVPYAVAPTGIPEVDLLLHGGFPVGALSEVVGLECSGRTSLVLAFVAGMTQAGKVCAWVDVSDALHPESAAAMGVDLTRLLWVRNRIMLHSPQSFQLLPSKRFQSRGRGWNRHYGLRIYCCRLVDSAASCWIWAA
jgi:RecA/RadA recombinase